MFQIFANFLKGDGSLEFDTSGNPSDLQIKVSAATLLWLVSRADGKVEKVELDQIARLMISEFGLDLEELQEVSQFAQVFANNKTFVNFTYKLKESLSLDQRKKIIKMAEKVAHADKKLCKHEAEIIDTLKSQLLE